MSMCGTGSMRREPFTHGLDRGERYEKRTEILTAEARRRGEKQGRVAANQRQAGTGQREQKIGARLTQINTDWILKGNAEAELHRQECLCHTSLVMRSLRKNAKVTRQLHCSGRER